MTISLISADNPFQNMLLHFTEFQERSKSVLRCLIHFQLQQEKSFQSHQHSLTPLCNEETSIFSAVVTLSLFQKYENKKQLLLYFNLKYQKMKCFQWDCLFCSCKITTFFQISREKLPYMTAGPSTAVCHMAILKYQKKKLHKAALFHFTTKYSSQDIYIAFYYFF